LTTKGQPFIWREEQEESFLTSKARFIEAPVLASPNDKGEYVLDTDASQYGLDTVLQQKQGDDIHVIAYASRCLSRAERNYNTTRPQLLAVIFGLKQCRAFFLGRQYLLRVDHSALSYLKKTPEVMGQAARWLEVIEEHTFIIQHRSGASHGNCDTLSRRPCGDGEREEPGHHCCRRTKQAEDREADRGAAGREADESLNSAPESIAKAQLEAVNSAAPRSVWRDVQSSSEETRAFWAQYKSLKIINSVHHASYIGLQGCQ